MGVRMTRKRTRERGRLAHGEVPDSGEGFQGGDVEIRGRK